MFVAENRSHNYDNDIFVFDKRELMRIANSRKDSYRSESPFPHGVFDSFLPDYVAERALAEFPNKNSSVWLDWRNRDIHQPKKLGIGTAENIIDASPYLLHVLNAFYSHPMIEFLETLTGIKGLLPDPHFQGGGLHQTLSGGKLAIHADFNYEERIKLYRRINVIYYLNKDWKEEYKGHVEVWDKEMTKCLERVSPIFNRAFIFNTSRYSYHGHPDPLNTPENITRKSMAIYYYTRDPWEGEEEPFLTVWKKRPGEIF